MMATFLFMSLMVCRLLILRRGPVFLQCCALCGGISRPIFWPIYFPHFALRTKASGTLRAAAPWIFSGLSALSAAIRRIPRALSNGRAALRNVKQPCEQEIAQKEAAAEQGNEDLDFAVRHSKRLAADLRALRPALDALVAISRSAIENAPLSSLWPMLRDVLRPMAAPTRPRASHGLERSSRYAWRSDATCGSLTGDDALKVIEDVILSTRVPAWPGSASRLFMSAPCTERWVSASRPCA